MAKGSIDKILSIFIAAVVILLIVAAAYNVIKGLGAHMAESISTGSSAEDIADAVNDINECIEENGEGRCTEEITLDISVPQGLEDSGMPYVGADPLWVIYHDKCLSNDDDTGLPGENDDSCENIGDVEPLVKESDCECHSLWDSGKFAPRCENDFCWGMVENQAPGRSQVNPRALERLQSFYIIDPCYARIKVRENPANPGKIEICFEEPLEPPVPGYANWCCADPDKVDCALQPPMGKEWPFTANGVWNGLQTGTCHKC